MRVTDLEAAFDRRGVPRSYYSTTDRHAEGQYVITHDSTLGWITYAYERGVRVDERWFLSEDEACRSFYDWVIESFERHAAR